MRGRPLNSGGLQSTVVVVLFQLGFTVRVDQDQDRVVKGTEGNGYSICLVINRERGESRPTRVIRRHPVVHLPPKPVFVLS